MHKNWYDEPVEKGLRETQTLRDQMYSKWREVVQTYHDLGFRRNEIKMIVTKAYKSIEDELVISFMLPIVLQWITEIWHEIELEKAAESA